MMSFLTRAIRSEFLKFRRTLAFWVLFAVPLVIVLLQMGIILKMGSGREGMDVWMTMLSNIAVIWSLLMMPLLITLESSLLANTEDSVGAWKQLFVQPIPRMAVYWAKVIMLCVVIGVSTLALLSETIALGLVFRVVKPELGFDIPIPIIDMFWLVGKVYLLSLLIMALHTYAAIRSGSFVFSSAFGIMATVSSIVVFQSDKWIHRYPWTMGATSVIHYLEESPDGSENFAILLAVNLIGFLLISMIGGWEYCRRDVK